MTPARSAGREALAAVVARDGLTLVLHHTRIKRATLYSLLAGTRLPGLRVAVRLAEVYAIAPASWLAPPTNSTTVDSDGSRVSA